MNQLAVNITAWNPLSIAIKNYDSQSPDPAVAVHVDDVVTTALCSLSSRCFLSHGRLTPRSLE